MIYEFIYFFNELDLLEAKLYASRDAVDKFIIIEAPTDLLHRPKPLYYAENRERFSAYNHKITHIVTPDGDSRKTGYPLYRERLAYVVRGLGDCKPNDIIIITDPDVVLKEDTYGRIEKLDLDNNEAQIVSKWFVYWMDFQFTKMNYAYTSAYLFKNTVGSQWETVHRWKPALPPLEEAGWHFAKLGGVDKLLENISGYPHLELDTDKRKNREELLRKMEGGYAWDDAWPGERVMVEVPYIPQEYPEFINKHPEIYAKYFRNGMKAPQEGA